MAKKSAIIFLLSMILMGCVVPQYATREEDMHYETIKSVSRDKTAAEIACWSAVTELGKSGDRENKNLAISMAPHCRSELPRISPIRQKN